ncbi:unnamed protein product [Echinostoma caproni]|uniref:Cytochrome b5 heme-binding domain-containing protein n=1 Tax=Echinostoma caproni TaxID=27848 RepID=A0A183A7K6_9TREM|nr:unnamed protein product [Echinostoma caproni]
MCERKITWTEIEQHSSKHDRWIVMENKVYDVSKWQNRHPGGRKIIGHYAAQDATVEAFIAFHKDLEIAKKYLKAYFIGDLETSEIDSKRTEHLMRRNKYVKDFEEVRSKLLELVRNQRLSFSIVFPSTQIFKYAFCASVVSTGVHSRVTVSSPRSISIIIV